MKTLLRGVLGLVVLGGVACADSDRYPEPQAVLTGVFLDSAVSQLRYETATQNGFTSDAGEFTYVAGERITFSLGGITLGSGPAGERVTPFDLFGGTIPSTEGAIRGSFDDLGYASPLERIANISMFLIALDADTDPSNGIDLTGLDAVLLNATLDFDIDTSAFMLQRLRPLLLTYDVGNASVPVTTPLSHLYETVGVSVPVHMFTTRTADTNGDGVVDAVITNTYDAQGHQIRTTTDSDNDGVLDTVVTLGYAGDRIITRLQETSPDPVDGRLRRQRSSTYAYNAAGLITNQTNEVRVSGTLTQRQVLNYVYDGDSNQVSFTTVTDDGVDGTPDQTNTVTATYNAAGFATLRESNNVGTTTSRLIEEFTYDEANHVVASTVSTDASPDETPDQVTRTTTTYDTRGLPAAGTNEVRNGAGTVTTNQRFNYTYNAARELVTTVLDDLDVVSGEVTTRTTTTNVYVNNELVNALVERDAGADGVVDGTSTRTIVNDPHGLVLVDITEADTDNDGTLNTINTVTWERDANGNATYRRIDSYTLGGATTASVLRWDYSEVPQGVYAMSYYYNVNCFVPATIAASTTLCVPDIE